LQLFASLNVDRPVDVNPAGAKVDPEEADVGLYSVGR